MPLETAVNLQITTIEGIGETNIGKRVQERWLALDVPQCGYWIRPRRCRQVAVPHC